MSDNILKNQSIADFSAATNEQRNNRMTNERLAEIRKIYNAMEIHQSSQLIGELLQELKAERKRIEELEAKLKRVEALRDYIQTSGNRAVYCAAQQMTGSATAGFYKNLLKRLEKALEEKGDD